MCVSYISIKMLKKNLKLRTVPGTYRRSVQVTFLKCMHAWLFSLDNFGLWAGRSRTTSLSRRVQCLLKTGDRHTSSQQGKEHPYQKSGSVTNKKRKDSAARHMWMQSEDQRQTGSRAWGRQEMGQRGSKREILGVRSLRRAERPGQAETQEHLSLPVPACWVPVLEALPQISRWSQPMLVTAGWGTTCRGSHSGFYWTNPESFTIGSRKGDVLYRCVAGLGNSQHSRALVCSN